MSEQLARGEVDDLLRKRSKSDPRFREALLKDPRAVLEGQMGTKIPANITVKAVEETSNTLYVVVPYVGLTGGELSDDALEAVSGGQHVGAPPRLSDRFQRPPLDGGTQSTESGGS